MKFVIFGLQKEETLYLGLRSMRIMECIMYPYEHIGNEIAALKEVAIAIGDKFKEQESIDIHYHATDINLNTWHIGMFIEKPHQEEYQQLIDLEELCKRKNINLLIHPPQPIAILPKWPSEHKKIRDKINKFTKKYTVSDNPNPTNSQPIIKFLTKVYKLMKNGAVPEYNKIGEVPWNTNLHTDQMDALIYFYRSFFTDRSREFLLVGYAGTGKTTLIQELINKLSFYGYTTCLTAPTNKAVQVLASMARDNIISQTIQKLLGLGMEIDLNDDSDLGKRILKKVVPAKIASYNIVILDETSMVNTPILRYLRNEYKTSRTKIVFMGDDAQLPPIGDEAEEMSISPSFLVHNSKQLTHIIRQGANNPLLKVLTGIRNNLDKPIKFIKRETTIVDGNGIIYTNNKDEFIQKAIDAFKNNNGDYTYCKYLAYHNDEVDKVNKIIRKALFDTDSPIPVVGEIVIAKKPSYTYTSKVEDREQIAFTSQEFKIISIVKTNSWRSIKPHIDSDLVIKGSIQLSSYVIKMVDIISHELVEAAYLDPKSINDYNSIKSKLRDYAVSFPRSSRAPRKKAWEDFFNFTESFLNIAPGYALTVHKSQGSTYNTVFVNVEDVLTIKDLETRNRCLYTALSRPSAVAHVF